MKVLYFDCTSGISGDMSLGALIDLGVDSQYLQNELLKLNITGYELIVKKIEKNNIMMTDVDVIIDEALILADPNTDDYCSVEKNRNLIHINRIIDSSTINDRAKKMSKHIFLEIALAEAKAHGKELENVYFHEIGAIDSIIDIVGVSICIAALSPDKILASELHDGSGFIKCRNGMVLPVPVPAVKNMLENANIPLVQEEVHTEMITPTGMGIIKCLAEKYQEMPQMVIHKIGYGRGKRNTGKRGAVKVVMGDLI
ncbi:nickel pincer cofactor biosynthesis protein LarC [Fusibacter ferrireducens]|uniref:LarC family nickel insertion protein n=1 Tax=Fusibacter ferrireducens TaxID=2785058 RepID=A0ABR9ZW94_9FIRM|nr:LarC family nickel insertion protein [Fusibacter ferrireducens]MBF4694715.1 LarC family nickel insertion protein [Fusibacter ferrireducens]